MLGHERTPSARRCNSPLILRSAKPLRRAGVLILQSRWLLTLGAKGARRGAWEQRHMGVLGHPLLADSLSPEHHGCPSGPIKRLAVFGIAGGFEHCHADRRETVA